MLQEKPGSCDVGFVAVLLEKHPLKDERPPAALVRKKARAGRKVREDGVGFGEHKAVVVEDRGSAVGIDLKKIRRAALAFQNVDVDYFTGNPKLVEQQADFVGVARDRGVIELHGWLSFRFDSPGSPDRRAGRPGRASCPCGEKRKK